MSYHLHYDGLHYGCSDSHSDKDERISEVSNLLLEFEVKRAMRVCVQRGFDDIHVGAVGADFIYVKYRRKNPRLCAVMTYSGFEIGIRGQSKYEEFVQILPPKPEAHKSSLTTMAVTHEQRLLMPSRTIEIVEQSNEKPEDPIVTEILKRRNNAQPKRASAE